MGVRPSEICSNIDIQVSRKRHGFFVNKILEAPRPWPAPQRPWSLAMTWDNLAFIHWPVSAEQLAPLIPPPLTLDLYDGTAWLGLVPFEMRDVHPRSLPALPWISHFMELNLRTYVTAGGKPGVWFFSLDAANPIAVWLARRFFHLPYYNARMSNHFRESAYHYFSQRTHRNASEANLMCSYRETGPEFTAEPGTLDDWLTARYCLYAADKSKQVWRGEIHHQPWPLQPAETEISVNTMFAPIGMKAPQTPFVVHFAKSLPVIAWDLEPV